jgi:3-oxoacyl-[acyl-carrier-protein] synthase III
MRLPNAYEPARGESRAEGEGGGVGRQVRMIESSSPAARTSAAAALYPVALAGCAAARPRAVVASGAFDERLGLAPGTVESLTGVRERAVAREESVVDLAADAARAALRAARCDARALDCVIVASTVPYQPIPTTAVFVKRALGLDDSPIPAFDVNATCIGFLAALDCASALIAGGRYDRVLVAAADLPGRGVAWSDPKVAGIFGDGAAAVVVERAGAGDRGILAFGLETYTEGAQACVLRAGGTGLDPHGDYAAFLRGTYFEMDGSIAYRVAAKYLPPFVDGLLARAGVTMDEIDCVVPHQASATAMALMQRRLRIPRGRMIDIFAEHGNQVAASLPTALAAAVERGAVRDGSLVLLLGTAAGITIGGAVWRV